jgi:hypothetical protein
MTKPSRLPVLLKVPGHPELIAKSPVVRGSSCHPRCLVKVTARLWTAAGKSTGTISLALYRE